MPSGVRFHQTRSSNGCSGRRSNGWPRSFVKGPLHERDPVCLNAVVTIIRVVPLISARAGLFERPLREHELQEAEERFRPVMGGPPLSACHASEHLLWDD
jgi:hypothetical protein